MPTDKAILTTITAGTLTGAILLATACSDKPPAPAWVISAETGTVNGRELFERYCVVCHMADAKGNQYYPPLHGSAILASDTASARVLLHGIAATPDSTWLGAMVGYEASMTDAEIAAIVTYARWLTDQNSTPMATSAVAAERAASRGRTAPWTRDDLPIRTEPPTTGDS